MKKFKVTVSGTYENNSWHFEETVIVNSFNEEGAKKQAIEIISWPPGGLDIEEWNITEEEGKN